MNAFSILFASGFTGFFGHVCLYTLPQNLFTFLDITRKIILCEHALEKLAFWVSFSFLPNFAEIVGSNMLICHKKIKFIQGRIIFCLFSRTSVVCMATIVGDGVKPYVPLRFL